MPIEQVGKNLTEIQLGASQTPLQWLRSSPPESNSGVHGPEFYHYLAALPTRNEYLDVIPCGKGGLAAMHFGAIAPDPAGAQVDFGIWGCRQIINYDGGPATSGFLIFPLLFGGGTVGSANVIAATQTQLVVPDGEVIGMVDTYVMTTDATRVPGALVRGDIADCIATIEFDQGPYSHLIVEKSADFGRPICAYGSY